MCICAVLELYEYNYPISITELCTHFASPINNYPTDTDSQAKALPGGAASLLQPRLALPNSCTTSSKIDREYSFPTHLPCLSFFHHAGTNYIHIYEHIHT